MSNICFIILNFIRIKKEANNLGISIKDEDIIIIQHADDLTVALEDKNSLDLSLKIIQINVNKTECILLATEICV